MTNTQQDKPILKIGLITDPQYKDAPANGERQYKESLWKLKEAIDTLNYYKVDFVQNLGDIIDKGWESYNSIMPIYAMITPEIECYHALGNHDFSVDSILKTKVLNKLSMPDYYYSYVKKNWRFIVLDGTDYAYFSNSLHNHNIAKIDELYAKTEGKENHYKWNGGIGGKQKKWLKEELKNAEISNQNVIVFCHYPVRPYHAATLWNSDEIVDILKKSSNVVAYINGHHHSSGYAFEDGIHFVTLFAMVNTMVSSYSILDIYKDRLVIKGFGNQKSMILNKHSLNTNLKQY